MERQKQLSTRDRISIFVTGAVSAFDLSGRIAMRTSHNRLLSRKTDAQTLRSDWEVVGKDMRTAIEKVEIDRRNNH